MDHQGVGVGSQNEAFYDLLKTSKINSNPNFFSRSGENPTPDYEFGNDSVQPNFDFHQMQSNGAAASPPPQNNIKGMYGSSSSSSTRADESLSGGLKAHQASAPPSTCEPQVYGSHEPSNAYEYPSQWQDQGLESAHSAIVVAVDRTMKKYADGILHLLGTLNEHTSQLQSRTQQLEYSVQVLKNSVADGHADIHGKLQSLENLIREVQTGMQVLSEKQDIAETKSQLAKLQLKNDASGNISTSASSADAPARVATYSSQSELAMKQHSSAHAAAPSTPPPASVQQQLPPPPPSAPYQPPPLLPPFPQPLYPPGQQQNQQEMLHQATLQQQSIPSAPEQPQLPPRQHHLPPQIQPQSIHMFPQLPPQVSQGPPLLQQYNPQPDVSAFGPPPYGQHFQGSQQPPHYSTSSPPDVPPYMPAKYEPLPERQPPQFQSPPLPPHGPSGQPRYEPFPGKPPAHVLAASQYMAHPQPVSASPGYESPSSVASSGYGNPGYRVPQPSPSPSGGRYPRLPTAQPVNATSNPASANPVSSGNTSVDEVIENVASMGFSRDKARAVIRRLTENGQSVDLNNVLDRLMNGGDSQPQKPWHGR